MYCGLFELLANEIFNWIRTKKKLSLFPLVLMQFHWNVNLDYLLHPIPEKCGKWRKSHSRIFLDCAIFFQKTHTTKGNKCLFTKVSKHLKKKCFWKSCSENYNKTKEKLHLISAGYISLWKVVDCAEVFLHRSNNIKVIFSLISQKLHGCCD